MAKSNKETKEVTPAIPAAKPKKPKYFKLGANATLFVDPASQKKIVNTQIVEFTDKDMSTAKFKEAKRGGHIVEADADDIEAMEEKTNTGKTRKEKVEINPELAAFLKLPDNAAKAQFIKDEYENTPEEELALDVMNDDELLVAFKAAEGIED